MASRRLSTYRAKRNFRQTTEPSGSGTVAASARLRFVVQKHAARRLRYDLRLELDGAFKCWAVTRGPSLDPADKRLAVEVEDHPLEYGDFEGTIPQGQYGGGTVQLWDRGYWEPHAKTTPGQALRAGELKLTLQGERLRGDWVLVRLRNSRSKRPSWLLIKHRDEFARAGDGLLLEEDRSVASGRTLAQIAAGRGRGPKAFMTRGRGAGRPNVVWNSNTTARASSVRAGRPSSARGRGAHRGETAAPARMPKFIEPALCRLLPRPPEEGGVYRDGRLVPVGRIGTGFSAAKMRQLLPRLKKLASNENSFGQRVPVPSSRKIHWLKPELVAEIEFAGWTEGGNIRQAAFKGLREDKPAREVQAATAAPVERAAARHSAGAARQTPASRAGARSKHAARPRTRRSTQGSRETAPAAVPILGVTISNPDKVLWPHAGDGRPVTKREFAEYLAAAGEWMLPHIDGRPCSLVRCPDGIGGQRFFQRHAMPGLSSLIRLARVSGDRKPYVQVDRLEGLAALAQIAALELHPWNCIPHRPEVPGRLVFDLDPAPDVGLEAVIEAAREMRERLEALGLESFLKTTGGKGLHVVAPFTQPRGAVLDWALVKSFARELCARMAADSPQDYVIDMAKRVRVGRIFLDYLRNDHTATAVAPLSPRAREGAPVSMPLTWAQARTGLDPRKFTIRTARALLARSGAWQEYSGAARPLLPAVEKLVGDVARAGANRLTIRAPAARRQPLRLERHPE